jgi:hypothetical protein
MKTILVGMESASRSYSETAGGREHERAGERRHRPLPYHRREGEAISGGVQGGLNPVRALFLSRRPFASLEKNMRSPFPGMNPFLEQSDAWTGFHDDFIVRVR